MVYSGRTPGTGRVLQDGETKRGKIADLYDRMFFLMAFGSEWRGVEHLPLSGEARCSQASATSSEASEERVAPASGERAACARARRNNRVVTVLDTMTPN